MSGLPSLPVALGRRLRRLRLDRGWTQASLAARVGVRTETLRRYERGVCPRLAVLIRFSQHFELGLDELVNGLGGDSPCRRAILHRLAACEALSPHMAQLLFSLIDAVLAINDVAQSRTVHLTRTEARP